MLDTLLRSGIWMAKRPGVTFDALQVYKSMDFVKSHFLQNPYFRDLYDPKIKRIFEIMQAGYKIILLLHFYPPKKALGSFQGV